MNLNKLKEILSYPLPDDNIKRLIFKEIAKDDDAIPTILGLLKEERKNKHSLLTEINFQLSRAHIGLEKPEINEDHFMDKEILEFYMKNKDMIGHCFKNLKD